MAKRAMPVKSGAEPSRANLGLVAGEFAQRDYDRGDRYDPQHARFYAGRWHVELRKLFGPLGAEHVKLFDDSYAHQLRELSTQTGFGFSGPSPLRLTMNASVTYEARVYNERRTAGEMRAKENPNLQWVWGRSVTTGVTEVQPSNIMADEVGVPEAIRAELAASIDTMPVGTWVQIGPRAPAPPLPRGLELSPEEEARMMREEERAMRRYVAGIRREEREWARKQHKKNGETTPLARHSVHPGMLVSTKKIVPDQYDRVGGAYRVFRASPAQVVIGYVSTVDTGRFTGKRYTFRWDGEKYVRGGDYLVAREEFRPNDAYSPFHEQFPGGYAAGMQPEDFDPEQLAKGVAVEMREHGVPREMATELAMDQLAEDPAFYEKEGQEEQLYSMERYGFRNNPSLVLGNGVMLHGKLLPDGNVLLEEKTTTSRKPWRVVRADEVQRHAAEWAAAHGIEHTPNAAGYYVWPLGHDSKPLVGEGPWGPYAKLHGAKTFARIGATEGQHDRAVTIGRDPSAPSFRIVRVYSAGTGKRRI